MPFKFTKLDMPGLVLIEHQKFHDDRGYFFESYKSSEFSANGIPSSFMQGSYSISKKNVLRGIHYQINPKAQGKLVSVIKGRVFDVVVDIRRGSPRYGKWDSFMLAKDDNKMLWIPEGFAHGFLALEDDTVMSYNITGSEWSKDHERGIVWNDKKLGIKWPVPDPVVSEKDSMHPTFEKAEINFVYR